MLNQEECLNGEYRGVMGSISLFSEIQMFMQLGFSE
jgi:hypothetical protein